MIAGRDIDSRVQILLNAARDRREVERIDPAMAEASVSVEIVGRPHRRDASMDSDLGVPHAFQYRFVKTKLSGGYLKLRRARNLIDGSVEGAEDRPIGRMHCDKNRNPEHDPCECQTPSENMPSEIRPAQ